MSHSYNGWPFIGADRTVRAVVPGTEDVRIEIRRGEVATILNAWAALWHRRVRPLDTYRPRDYWGWSATNSHATSCHLSGTAVDLNATTLPFRRHTMPADQRATVDQLVDQFRGVVAWGGHWGDPVDEMHAEISVPPGDPRLAALTADLSAGYLDVWPAPAPIITPPPQEDPVMPLTPRQAHQLDDVTEQLTGSQTPGEFPGYDQLGGRTPVDALAAIGAHLAIDGFKESRA